MSPLADTDATLDEDLAEAVVAAIIATAGHEGRILDETVVRRFVAGQSVSRGLASTQVAGDDLLAPFLRREEQAGGQPGLSNVCIRSRVCALRDPRAPLPSGSSELTRLASGTGLLAVEGKTAYNCLDWKGTWTMTEHPERHVRHAASQPAETFIITPPPEYPFQSTVAGMLQHEGHTYMAYADRLSGLLELAHFPCGVTSQKIKTHLRRYFTRRGAPGELSSELGMNLGNEGVAEFLKNWGVAARLSSAQCPPSKRRAEAAIKTEKRIIKSNTDGGGTLDTDKASFALCFST